MTIAVKRALKENRLLLYGQPIKSIYGVDEPVQAVEVLLRMRDGDRILNAGEFLPAIQNDLDLQVEIDRWVLAKSAEMMKRSQIDYSVNLSRTSLLEPKMFTIVRNNFKAIAPDRLTIEVAEHGGTYRQREIQLLTKLARWYKLELDDVGDASLEQVRQLPVTGIKVAGKLVSNIASSKPDCAFVEALMLLAWRLGFSCTCEQVASDRIWQILMNLAGQFDGLDVRVQGYAVGKPASLETWMG